MSKEADQKGVYGFVLIMRGLGRAAIQLKDHPAALRVLVVAAEYMNKNGRCRISQGTIAARLDMSRQAVNRHFALLDRLEILVCTSLKDGVTREYVLNTIDLENEREGQERVDERRAAKRAQKLVKPERAYEQELDRRRREGEYTLADREGYAAYLKAAASGMNQQQCRAQMVEEESRQGLQYRSLNRETSEGEPLYRKVHIGAPAASEAPFATGCRVYHQKFGYGRIVAVDENKLTVEFDKAGEKCVASSFVELAPATSEVAGGAT